MINVILDPLPDVWVSEAGEEYRVNTDFRVGIQLALVANDPDLSRTEKTEAFLDLLFCNLDESISDKMPYMPIPSDPQYIEDIIEWLCNGWNHDGESSIKPKEAMTDFDIDQWRIYAEFMAKYHIDLSNPNLHMHYWKFAGLLSCLEGVYAQVITIRQKEIDPKMSQKDKAVLRDAKEVYRIGRHMSKEDKQIRANINDFLGGNIDWSKNPNEQKLVSDFMKNA